MKLEGSRVCVTGVGVVSGSGLHIDDFLADLDFGEPPWHIQQEWQYEDMGPTFLAKTPTFDRKTVLPDLRAPFPPRYCQLAMIAAGDAISDATLDLVRTDRIGTVLATEFGPNELVERHLTALLQEGPTAVSPITFSSTVMNVALGTISRNWKLGGPSTMVLGEQPAIYAYDLLRQDRADAIVCGGVDEIRDGHVWVFSKAGVIPGSGSLAGPGNAECREASSEGLVMGDGSSCVIAERLDIARRRGARIYAEMVGWGASRDRGKSHFLTQRSADDIATAMTLALKDAHASPEVVGFVVLGENTHNGTRLAEQEAIRSVFSGFRMPQQIWVKGISGENFGASGPLAVAVAAKILQETTGEICLVNSIHGGSANNSVVLRSAEV